MDRRTFVTRHGLAVCAASCAAGGLTFRSAKAFQTDDATASPRKVAVTIDDGPATGAGDDLELYLEIANSLRKAFVAEKVPCVLFINEMQLNVPGQRDARAQVLQQWLDAGLEIGNHTYAHSRPDKADLQRYFADIVQGEVICREILRRRGEELIWYRYPYLSTSSGESARAIEEFLAKRGYRIAPVSVDYRDYSFAGNYSRLKRAGKTSEADELFQNMHRALDQAFEDSETRSQAALGYQLPQVLLIHCNELNADKLRLSLQRIRDRGYQFVTLDEALRDPAYQTKDLPPGAMGGGGGLFLSHLQQQRSGG